jgi:putative peptidoglycan lipid II flippase
MGLAVAMTRILSPFLLFVALAAVAMGMLNACGRYFLPALSPAAFNVAAILGVVILVPILPQWGLAPGLALAIGAIVGGLLQFVVQWPGLRAEGFRFRPEWGGDDPDLRRIGRLMLPATIGLAATQINILVDTVMASRFGNGPITWLALAFRLIQLPIGLFGVAIATANLTRVSDDLARGDLAGLRRNLADALRVAAMLALPATAGLVALREPIVRVIFEHGQFDAHATNRTAAAVLCYALGLFAYAVTKIQVPTFYALGEARTAVIASVSAVSLKVAATFALIAALPLFGMDPFLGLALSTSLAAWVNYLWLDRALRRRIGGLSGEGVLRATLQMVALSAVLGGACHYALRGLEQVMGGGGFWGDLARLAISMAIGGGVWLFGLWRFAPPELTQAMDRWRGGS